MIIRKYHDAEHISAGLGNCIICSKIFSTLTNPVNYNQLPKLLLLLTGILWLLFSNSYAQYYPAPAHVDPVKEDSHLRQLKKVTKGDERILLNLDLANIYFNKPLKRRSDLDRALQLAR